MDVLKTVEEAWEVPFVKEDGHREFVYNAGPEEPREIQMMPNCVFRASLIYLGALRQESGSIHHRFKDAHSGDLYAFSTKSIADLLFGISDGSICTEGNTFSGLFTFVKYSRFTYTRPLDTKETFEFDPLREVSM